MTLPNIKILYLVSEDWYFWSHRLPIARAARESGAQVSIATRVRDHGASIQAETFTLHPLELSRSGRIPLSSQLRQHANHRAKRRRRATVY